MGKPYTHSGWNDMNFVVEQWLNFKFTDDLDPDMFVKRRLSFVELAFRTRRASRPSERRVSAAPGRGRDAR